MCNVVCILLTTLIITMINIIDTATILLVHQRHMVTSPHQYFSCVAKEWPLKELS